MSVCRGGGELAPGGGGSAGATWAIQNVVSEAWVRMRCLSEVGLVPAAAAAGRSCAPAVAQMPRTISAGITVLVARVLNPSRRAHGLKTRATEHADDEFIRNMSAAALFVVTFI